MQAPSLTIGRYAIPLEPRAARNAFVREIRSMSLGLRLWLGLLLVLIGIAAVAAIVAVPPGWEVFGTTPSFEWGLMIVAYVFFAIMTSGLCLSSSLGTVFGIERFRPLEKRHAILAVLSLSTAFLVIALDLHFPLRMVFGAVLVPSPSSPMWWMGVFYGLYLVVLLVEVWSMFTPHPKVHQWSCTAAAMIAIAAPFTLGMVFGVLSAKAFWAGPLTPVTMVASAFLAGTALLGIVFWAVWRFNLQDRQRAVTLGIPSIRLLQGVAIVIVGGLLALKLVFGLTGDEPGLQAATAALVTGPLGFAFWTLRVIGGLVIPFVLLAMPMTRTPAWLGVGSILALGGVLVDRYLFVMAGQIAPITAGAGTVSSPYADYVPTLVEILIFVGAGALMAFVYTLAERYLDLEESDIHAFFPWPWLKAHDHEETGEPAHDDGIPAAGTPEGAGA
ncbi:MAG TPA: NrfD/PsrC family molybdoenzyme membrane anchor subunit [Candidatus Limnocylindrales bacterium]|nr:NrfD/PsrC family molybdoenzyme membrane anchor subunit [Candidatus Limnocylindrales bacterium]